MRSTFRSPHSGSGRAAPAAGPVVLRMRWHDLLFAHWPFEPAVIAPLLPPGLEPDLFDGAAWVGVVPFRMTRVRPLGLPLGPFEAFPEINVRTYARPAGVRRAPAGVWFLSLDTTSRAAVTAARLAFRLPYFHAQIEVASIGERVRYDARRIDRSGRPASFRATYAPAGPVSEARPGSLEAFLVERYRLFAAGPGGKILRTEIDHPHWPLQPAAWWPDEEGMLAAHGLPVPSTDPVLHFARRLVVATYAPRPIHRSSTGAERLAAAASHGRGESHTVA